MTSEKYSYLILDVGGVLVFNKSIKAVAFSPRQIANALDSPDWYEYERGKLTQEQCYEKVCQQFQFDLETWTQAIEYMRDTLQSNVQLISAVKQLKRNDPNLKVIGLSNIAAPDYEALESVIKGWGIFDDFHSSASLGIRKPDAACYKKFLKLIGASASSCVFVDDRLENIVSAHALGLRGVLFEDTEEAVATLHDLFGDPVARGLTFLRQNAKRLFCHLDSGALQPDNYSQLLILEHTGDRSLVSLEKKGVLWNYFIGDPIFANTVYPVDSDTTSLAMIVLDDIPMHEKEKAMDIMLQNLNPDGLPYCWLDKYRPRFCHCICANVWRFFYLNGQAHRLPNVYDFLCRLLRTNAHLFGTRYYTTPEWFFYYLSDVCSKCPDDAGLDEMRGLLAMRIQERMGRGGDLLGTALRVLAAQRLGVANPKDMETLLAAQQADGGWERVWVWRYGKEKVKLGSRGVITAMAVKAIRNAREIEARAQ
ncbi:Sesquiterpene cyclase astC [Cladobotryum mycophilum]|uniref:Sesquiterpene cyclase astC n=1 Tax=Cladobotryum mycophilum TaxID=491253 RepID=A0ABR0S7Z1_9HYPO